jgi:acyl carrier protein
MNQNAIATDRDHLAEIARIAADIFSVSAAEVAAAESFVRDLDTDSLLAIELLTRLEKHYGIYIPESEVERMVNLHDTYAIVADRAGW